MTDAQDIERALVEETNRLTAERLPVGALAFLLVFATSWIFEHRAHPERDVSFACMYGAQEAGRGRPLSARLAQAMGGQLSVNSEIGRGSTFVLRLPVAA